MSNFLSVTQNRYPDLDRDCLSVNPHRELASPISDYQAEGGSGFSVGELLPPAIHKATAVVKEHLGESVAILEDPGRRWCCFLTADNALLSGGRSLSHCMPLNALVMVNARLVDPGKKVQYVAQLSWDPREFPDQERAPVFDLQIDQGLLQKFKDTVEMLEMTQSTATNVVGAPVVATAAAAAAAAAATAAAVSPHPACYERQEGSVFLILDDNYGLIRVGRTTNLVLFDVCDFWVDPRTTASKKGLTLASLVHTESKVLFHANLLNGANKIQYLASSVWLWDANFPPDSQPKPIQRENIHRQKQTIYETVVASVPIPDLGDSVTRPQVQEGVSFPVSVGNKDLSMKQFGIVRILFVRGHDPGALEQVGGLLEVGHKSYCFFLKRHCKPPLRVSVGTKLYCNTYRVRRSCWPGKVDSVALSLYQGEMAAETPPEMEAKREESLKQMLEIGEDLGSSPAFLDDPSKPAGSIVNLTYPEKVRRNSHKEHSVTRYQEEQIVAGDTAKLKYMLNESCGLLEDEGKLIYFEVNDVNIRPALPMLNLASLLLPQGGNKVEYRATAVEGSAGVIHLAVVTRGIQLSGVPSKDLMSGSQRTFPSEWEMVPTSTRNEQRLARYLKAEACVVRGEVTDVEDVLLRTRRVSSSAQSVATAELIARDTGVVRYVLNENFGLISVGVGGRSGLCLFDTFDLHVTQAGDTAAKRTRPVGDFLKRGDQVMFNACLIDAGTGVPYLATAVWTPQLVPGGVDPIDRRAIQKDKIEIYKQVVESVKDMLARDQAKATGQQAGQPEVAKSAEAIVQLDLHDFETMSTLGPVLSQQYAILNLMGPHEGEKALVHERRVWIHDKPKFGNWRALTLNFFKTQVVAARRVEGFEPAFKYQVVFCHSGMRNKDLYTRRYKYPDRMKEWINPLLTVASLDQELQQYRAIAPALSATGGSTAHLT